MNGAQEVARFRALDDAVVVGRGERHHFLGADLRADLGQPDGVGDRSGGNDRALADHQPRHRGDGAQTAGVGQRDVGADQVVGAQRVVARLLHERVVGAHELLERLATGVANDRHHQRVRAVLLLDVDGKTEMDGAVVEAMWLAVDLLKVGCHDRQLAHRACDRIGDQVREGDLDGGRFELASARVERANRDRAERRCGRDRAALVHVAREHRGAALDRCGARLWRFVPAGGGIEHVRLEDPTAWTAP